MKIVNTFFLVIFFLTLNAQKSNHDYNIRNFEVQFIRTGVEGTILFKVISIGRNTEQAITNAKADAIKAVLFHGIPNSDLVNPLILSNKNFDQKNIYFFETFFKSEKYLDFLTIANDGSIAGEDRVKFKGKYKIGLIVSVNKKQLRQYLENNNIINKLSNGF